MSKLNGRIALITGAAGGQGSAEAELLASQGATVVVADIDAARCASVVEGIEAAGGTAAALAIDVSRAESWQSAAEWIEQTYGRLDILVNNAGVLSLAGVLDLEEDEWDRVVRINQKGVWLGMKYSVPLMKDGGAIVNTSSIYAHVGSGSATAYQATKGAVYAMTRTAAAEFAPRGIRVNSIEPGFIATAMTTDVIAEYGDDHPDVVRALIKRPGTAQEIANGVLYLVSDDASFVTGLELRVDGGRAIS